MEIFRKPTRPMPYFGWVEHFVAGVDISLGNDCMDLVAEMLNQAIAEFLCRQ